MLDWLMRVLGLSPAATPKVTTPSAPTDLETPAAPFTHEDATAESDHSVPPEAVSEELPPDHLRSDHDSPIETATLPPIDPEPVAPSALQFRAFTIHSSAGALVFARPDDARLVHDRGNQEPEGWAVHGFVTDAHPGILFVLAAQGATALSGHGERFAAHALWIEEGGEGAFALFDLSTQAYVCATQFLPGVNTLENDRSAVDAWERFQLVAAEEVQPPEALFALLPPAGTQITASTIESWRGDKLAG